jgi:SAM-dependent methyltransferase
LPLPDSTDREALRRHLWPSAAICGKSRLIHRAQEAQDVRALLYDAALVRLTAAWYRAVLERVPAHSHLLDVGIGTGGALMENAPLLAEKDLRVTGVDIDRAYIERCRAALSRASLTDRVEARLESVYDHRGGPYGAAYFSASFMLMPDPPAALRHVSSLLAPGARIFFTQTFEHERSKFVERIKPLLRHITTVDFGRVTYEADFRAALAAGGAEIEEVRTIGDAGRKRSSWLVVAKRGMSNED